MDLARFNEINSFFGPWSKVGTPSDQKAQLHAAALIYKEVFDAVQNLADDLKLRDIVEFLQEIATRRSAIIMGMLTSDIVMVDLENSMIKSIPEENRKIFHQFCADKYNQLAPYMKVDWVITLVGAHFVHLAPYMPRNFPIPPSVLFEATSYKAWEVLVEKFNSADKDFGGVFSRFEDSGKTILNSMHETLITIRNDAKEIAASRDKAKSEVAALADLTRISEKEATRRVAELKAAIDQTHGHCDSLSKNLSQSEAGILARLASLDEKISMRSIHRLWDYRATRSEWSFWLSASLIATLLMAIIFLPFFYRIEISTFMAVIVAAIAADLPPEPTTSKTAIVLASHLFVVTLPLIFYVWIIKLVIRFNSRSLVQADDAK